MVALSSRPPRAVFALNTVPSRSGRDGVLNFTPQLIAQTLSIAATGIRTVGIRNILRNTRSGTNSISFAPMLNRAELIAP
jgi:hypothetical protein